MANGTRLPPRRPQEAVDRPRLVARRQPSPTGQALVRDEEGSAGRARRAALVAREPILRRPHRDHGRGVRDGVVGRLGRQGRKVSTIRGYAANLRNYIVPNLGTVKLQDLRASDLDRLYAHLLKTNGKRGKPISKTTVHHVHVQLGKMLNDAERKGLVIRNVARLADAPSQASSRNAAPEMKVWTPAELQRFLTHVGSYRAGPMLRLMAMTGIRRGELVALGWKNVDLRSRDDRHPRRGERHRQGRGARHAEDAPRTSHDRSRQGDQGDAQAAPREATRGAVGRRRIPTDGRVFTNEFGEPLRPHSVGQAFNRLVETCRRPAEDPARTICATPTLHICSPPASMPASSANAWATRR